MTEKIKAFCPYCKTGVVKRRIDCVSTQELVYTPKGLIEDTEIDEDINYLDDSWFECMSCGKGTFDGADDPKGLIEDMENDFYAS